MPNAAMSDVTAITRGTTAATTAPNAMSRMRNVSGIVRRSDASRPPLTSSWMSALARWLLSAWIVRFGCATRISSTNAGTGSSRCSRVSPSPKARDGMRTVERSGETRSAVAGAVSGSTSWSTVGADAPATVEVRAPRRVTTSVIAAAFAGSSTVPVLAPTTRSSCWLGSSLVAVPAPKTSYARADSKRDDWLLETAAAESVPPAARLTAKIPNVNTNHNAKTGQRWRALHPATRTVHGGRAGVRLGVGSDTAGSLPRADHLGRAHLAYDWLSIWARCSRPLKST